MKNFQNMRRWHRSLLYKFLVTLQFKFKLILNTIVLWHTLSGINGHNLEYRNCNQFKNNDLSEARSNGRSPVVLSELLDSLLSRFLHCGSFTSYLKCSDSLTACHRLPLGDFVTVNTTAVNVFHQQNPSDLNHMTSARRVSPNKIFTS